MQKTKEWNPEFKYETLTGTFKDYCGNIRDFTMVAISIPMDKIESPRVVKTVEFENKTFLPDKVIQNEYGEFIEFEQGHTIFFTDEKDVVISPVVKMLSIGVAVRCVRDDHDVVLGERIAYGKAVKSREHVLYVSQPGMINTKIVQAMLEQESEHFKKDPGSYLAGYNKDKFKYMETGKIATAELYDSSNKNVEPSFSSNKAKSVKERLIEEIDNTRTCVS